MKRAMTNNHLRSQHPSWKTATAVFLASMTQKTIAWKQARTKLILIIAEVPMQVDPSPDSSGHYNQ
jgi:hypothetical protein